MATTISGGFYADTAGNLRNANGDALTKEQQSAAEKHAAQSLQQKAVAERLFILSEAERNPVAKAIASMQQPAPVDTSARIAELEAKLDALLKDKK